MTGVDAHVGVDEDLGGPEIDGLEDVSVFPASMVWSFPVTV